MLILSLDSAGPACSACVWRDGSVVAHITEPMERGQDQRMMPLLLELMKRAAVGFDDLDRIAVTRGPGSFTGLRIGLAAARGIGLAANKPVIGIDRFAVFREQIIQRDKNLLVVINSKRKELYCKFYSAGNEEHNVPQNGANPLPLVGRVREGGERLGALFQILRIITKLHPPLPNPPHKGEGIPSLSLQSVTHNYEITMMTPEQIAGFIKDNNVTIVTGDAPEIAPPHFVKPTEPECVTSALLASRAIAGAAEFLPRPLYIRAPDVTMSSKSIVAEDVCRA